MIEENQKESFIEVLELFEELGLTKHVVLIGSWAEYFFDEFFSEDYYHDIATKDIDFLYRNLRLPDRTIPLISTLKEHGFIYDENPMTKVAKFYKSNIMELEFLTRVVGPDQMYYDIKSLGITTEGIRELNMLHKFSIEIKRDKYSVFVPEPAAYVVHKILINEKRVKVGKSEKDMRSVKNLLIQIAKHKDQRNLLIEIISNLTKKEKGIFDRVCRLNSIDLSFLNNKNEQVIL